jgi:predicted nucleotidyltransferase
LLKRHLNSGQPDDIRIAFIYGSYARNTENTDSDIDLAIIGNISGRKVAGLLAGVKSELKREINFAVYPESEFRGKISGGNHFLAGLLKEPKIFLIGNSHDLKRIAER